MDEVRRALGNGERNDRIEPFKSSARSRTTMSKNQGPNLGLKSGA
jgi:hypothetical protein